MNRVVWSEGNTVAWICHTSTQKISQHNKNFSTNNFYKKYLQIRFGLKSVPVIQLPLCCGLWENCCVVENSCCVVKVLYCVVINLCCVVRFLCVVLCCGKCCCVVKNSCCVVRFSVWRCGRFMPPYIHDDLGRKNRTTQHNCRLSATSLALRVIFSVS